MKSRERKYLKEQWLVRMMNRIGVGYSSYVINDADKLHADYLENKDKPQFLLMMPTKAYQPIKLNI